MASQILVVMLKLLQMLRARLDRQQQGEPAQLLLRLLNPCLQGRSLSMYHVATPPAEQPEIFELL